MDEHDEPGRPDQQRRLIPTSRREPAADAPPPVLEELQPEAGPSAAPDAAEAPAREPPPAEDRIDWLAPFENRLIIAGLSVLVLLALTAGVLLVFSRGDGSPANANVGVVVDDDDVTPTADSGLMAEALETTTLFNGPGESYSPLGTVPRGARVPIVGRNEDDTWLQVTYPPGSPLRGWVDIDLFSFTGSLDGVEIAGPGESPDIVVPTSPVFFEEPTDTPVPVEPTDTPEDDDPTDTPEPEATDTPVGTAAATDTPEGPAPTEPAPTTPAPEPTTAGEEPSPTP